MYTIGDPAPDIEALNEKCKKLLAEITSQVLPVRAGIRHHAGENLFFESESLNKLYVLRDGTLTYFRNGKQLFFLDEGDLIGLERYFSTHEAVVQSEFTVILDEFDADSFFSSVRSNQDVGRLWDNYLACQIALFTILLTQVKATEFSMKPDIRSFLPGEAIIEKGSVLNEMYTLLDGRAEITGPSGPLAQYEEGEWFGAISLLTMTPCAASVIARTDCMVMALDHGQFIELLHSRPGTSLKILEDMAKTIISFTGLSDLKVLKIV